MNWSNVRLILCREIRDQLRDRRTLFMIAVLPLLLYPLLGTTLFQVVQFLREHPTRVLVLGAENLPETPPLLAGNHFVADLFADHERAGLLEISTEAATVATPAALADRARQLVQAGHYEAVLCIPEEFSARLEELRRRLEPIATSQGLSVPEIPSPDVYFNTAEEKSHLTYVRVSQVLARWTEQIAAENLATSQVPAQAARPFVPADHDVAEVAERNAAVWSKLFPFMLLIWALTGAFYPAVDLCAGEKERGTLETLLISPAAREEIVWGKLLTIMLFSMTTAILNLLSIGITGTFVLEQLKGQSGSPPALAPFWLMLALIPISALFSALCLALAAFARSSKEGQYYLMPLVLISMPLTMLPMAPAVELNLGNSLIPITGVMLLLRSMLEGDYLPALPYVAPVVAVTLVCCLLALRWAVAQFNSENVLFRESERLDFGLWLKHLHRDRQATPSVAEAVTCGVSILVVQFFLSVALAGGASLHLPTTATVTQLVAIATPALMMTLVLTRGVRATLLLGRPRFSWLAASGLLAVCLHPLSAWVTVAVQRMYPLRGEIGAAYAQLVGETPSWPLLLLFAALLPAVCEELAFRGFILSGLRHLGSKWAAIAVSSFFFAVAHGIVQQSISAFLVGLVLGYLAVQTGSLWPCVVFHLVHNSLGIMLMQWAASPTGVPLPDSLLHVAGDGGLEYCWPLVAIGGLGAWWLGRIFWRLSYRKTVEEKLHDALRQHIPAATA